MQGVGGCIYRCVYAGPNYTCCGEICCMHLTWNHNNLVLDLGLMSRATVGEGPGGPVVHPMAIILLLVLFRKARAFWIKACPFLYTLFLNPPQTIHSYHLCLERATSTALPPLTSHCTREMVTSVGVGRLWGPVSEMGMAHRLGHTMEVSHHNLVKQVRKMPPLPPHWDLEKTYEAILTMSFGYQKR